jgi:DNA-binding HxlR family transcriptional regulator
VGIVHRTKHGYALTVDGQDLATDLTRLHHWADRWATRVRQRSLP